MFFDLFKITNWFGEIWYYLCIKSIFFRIYRCKFYTIIKSQSTQINRIILVKLPMKLRFGLSVIFNKCTVTIYVYSISLSYYEVYFIGIQVFMKFCSESALNAMIRPNSIFVLWFKWRVIKWMPILTRQYKIEFLHYVIDSWNNLLSIFNFKRTTSTEIILNVNN